MFFPMEDTLSLGILSRLCSLMVCIIYIYVYNFPIPLLNRIKKLQNPLSTSLHETWKGILHSPCQWVLGKASPYSILLSDITLPLLLLLQQEWSLHLFLNQSFWRYLHQQYPQGHRAVHFRQNSASMRTPDLCQVSTHTCTCSHQGIGVPSQVTLTACTNTVTCSRVHIHTNICILYIKFV